MSNLRSKPQPILIVDDNEDDYEAIIRAFKKVGLNNPVSLCKTGKESIEFLKSVGKIERPALILLDLNMPGMDGREVLRLIKEDSELRRIPVIIWTTSSNDKDIEACYQTGANAYMQKPVNFDNLLELIKRLREYWFETVLLPTGNE